MLWIILPDTGSVNAGAYGLARFDASELSSRTMQRIDNPDKATLEHLIEPLRRYNDRYIEREQPYSCAFVEHDDKNEVVGVSTGTVSYGWLYVETLWVHPDHRGSGLGTRLLRALEGRACERGAHSALVSTWAFQAPDFYQRAGYSEVTRLADRPAPHADIWLVRGLTALCDTDADGVRSEGQ